jgi:hypothetical protein
VCFLSAICSYAVLAYPATQRQRETGIGSAMGQYRSRMAKPVLDEALWLTVPALQLAAAGSVTLSSVVAPANSAVCNRSIRS